jgi:PKD repeat protein
MKKLILALLVVIIMVGTVACGMGEDSAQTFGPAITTAPTTTMATPETLAPGYKDDIVVAQAPAPTIIMEAAGSSGGKVYYTSAADFQTVDRLIIRTGAMVLVVEDVEAAIDLITDISTAHNGYVVTSNSWQDRDRMVGNIAIRVAVASFEQVMSELGNLAVEVRSESTSGQDVTEEYVDLAAKLRNLEASEAQLLELMKQAGDVSEILEVQRELVNTRDQIERTQGRMQYLEESAAMSYISIDLEQSKLTVEFSAENRHAGEGQDIRFYPRVAGGFEPYSYAWDFGDGATSTEEAPVHAYDAEGSYTVSLVVTDDRGNTESYDREDYITISPGWNAGGIASSAWNGFVGFLRVIADIIIWLGIFSPLWIVILVILYFTWWRKRKKAA